MGSTTKVRNPGARLHIVMVSGFAGFDALGQLQYYSGVTPLFRVWKDARAARRGVVLHYFDNFPTAAVVTRATRLRSYLAKRLARGEFQPADAVALIGHSTGGLDIRRLLHDLASRPDEAAAIDGITSGAPTNRDVLRLVHRVALLSVPHRGTNIADWVASHGPGHTVVLASLRAVVAAAQVPSLDVARHLLASLAPEGSGRLQLSRAVIDALDEADPSVGNGTPVRIAAAHEAASQLELWLRHMMWDFRAIEDLTARRPPGRPVSPAHFGESDEIGVWSSTARHAIEVRSYATLGRRPFPSTGPVAPWELLAPDTYPECPPEEKMDAAYCACYRACAGGPFSGSVGSKEMVYLSDAHRARVESWDQHRGIEPADNDGIVNTASMYWPHGARPVLVAADHMDVVGHHTLVEAAAGTGRSHQAYDLLGSSCGFGEEAFERLWMDVFDSCC